LPAVAPLFLFVTPFDVIDSFEQCFRMPGKADAARQQFARGVEACRRCRRYCPLLAAAAAAAARRRAPAARAPAAVVPPAARSSRGKPSPAAPPPVAAAAPASAAASSASPAACRLDSGKSSGKRAAWGAASHRPAMSSADCRRVHGRWVWPWPMGVAFAKGRTRPRRGLLSRLSSGSAGGSGRAGSSGRPAGCTGLCWTAPQPPAAPESSSLHPH
jgi:hypothetical protein